MQLLNKTIKNLKPDMKAIKPKVDEILKKINAALRKNKIKAAAVAGGSYAKGTLIKDDYDIDIFVRFKYSYKDEDISKLLAQVLKPLRPDLVHGSRDYFHVKNDKMTFEIVPVLECKDPKKAVNVTDMSPMHVDWVRKQLKNKPKLADDIKLAKQFCKASKLYGAESYIMGFSGHVLDILVIHYNGFLNLLKQAAKWQDRIVVDFNNYYGGRALNELNRSKTVSPLIVIDPILPARNAAAAMSRENYDRFKQAAKDFLAKPSEKYFEKKELTEAELKKLAAGNRLAYLSVTAKKGKVDIIGAKLLKCFSFIKQELEKNDFRLLDSGWGWDKKTKAFFWYIIRPEALSEYIRVMGPPMHEKSHVERFRQKHKDTFVEGNRIYTNIRRKFRQLEPFFSDVIKDSNVKERVAGVKLKL
jgi:tRNA nucleotidyltransferase (CCA-adding enzyme)